MNAEQLTKFLDNHQAGRIDERAKDNENSKQISLAGFLADKDRKTDRTMHLNAWLEHLQGDAGAASC